MKKGRKEVRGERGGGGGGKGGRGGGGGGVVLVSCFIYLIFRRERR